MIKKLEILAAAAGLAEGGDHQSALELMSELKAGLPANRRRILVVSKNAPLTQGPIFHGVGLAARLRVDLLFLGLFSRDQASAEVAETWRKGFQAMFEDVAARVWPGANPPWTHRHAVLYGETNPLLREACRRIGGVAMVILQKRHTQPCTINLNVPVFCFDADWPATSTES